MGLFSRYYIPQKIWDEPVLFLFLLGIATRLFWSNVYLFTHGLSVRTNLRALKFTSLIKRMEFYTSNRKIERKTPKIRF